MGLSDVDIAKVAQVVKEAMAEGSSEQVKQIRQLQAQVTTMRLEMPPPPPRDGGDGGGRKRARSTKAPSPRDRALDGKWVLQLDPFNVDNLGELTSMYGIAAKLTQFLAGTRIKLLTEGVSNAENNFNMLKAMVSFCHGARPALCTPRPELASLAAHTPRSAESATRAAVDGDVYTRLAEEDHKALKANINTFLTGADASAKSAVLTLFSNERKKITTAINQVMKKSLRRHFYGHISDADFLTEQVAPHRPLTCTRRCGTRAQPRCEPPTPLPHPPHPPPPPPAPRRAAGCARDAAREVRRRRARQRPRGQVQHQRGLLRQTGGRKRRRPVRLPIDGAVCGWLRGLQALHAPHLQGAAGLHDGRLRRLQAAAEDRAG